MIIKQVRNIHTHQRNDAALDCVCPNPDMNIKIKNIIDEIKNPPTIYNSKVCVKRQNMYCRNIDDTIEQTIKVMVEKIYTHIPIFENDKLVGVFSENTLLDIVNKESGIVISNDTRFKEIQKNLRIENHSFQEFKFISRNKNIYDIEDIFKDYFTRNKRLGCVYITENGKENEKILGMLGMYLVTNNKI